MTNLYFTIILFLLVSQHSKAKVGFGPGEQDWGYVQVRPNATMFWWLFYTTANVTSFYEKPLVIWLEGGPGGSSTGHGTFLIIGPLNADRQPREHNWVKEYNVLFIDSPVGVGFGHVDDETAFATTNEQSAEDLLTCIKAVFEKDPNLKNIPSYIVGESYGGKLAIEFARVWHNTEKAGGIESQLRGVALGAPWISPKDAVKSWAPYLFQTGMIDNNEYEAIEESVNSIVSEVENENWMNTTDLFDKTQDIITAYTKVDFGNILTNMTYDETESSYKKELQEEEQSFKSLMNDVKLTLNLTTVWDEQSSTVSDTHDTEFMKPVTDQVEYVLNNTDLKVYIYSGQLDLIVTTPGTLKWVNNLRWPNRDKWHSLSREPLVVNNIVEGYYKKYGNFAMYWLRRSGHRAPYDNPIAMLEIMANFTKNSED